MKTPLTIITTFFVISFFDGFFEWGLSEGFYALAGFVMIFCLFWLWKIELGA